MIGYFRYANMNTSLQSQGQPYFIKFTAFTLAITLLRELSYSTLSQQSFKGLKFIGGKVLNTRRGK